MMDLLAYPKRELQNTRSLLLHAKQRGMSMEAVLAAIDKRLTDAVPGALPSRPDYMRANAGTGRSRRCPVCKRGVMVRPSGVAEPVLVCPACRYSEYGR